jgi:hypothetical protein
VIGIEYDAIAVEPGPNLNKATASGHCSVDYDTLVVSGDLALVMVYPEEAVPPPPEDVLGVELVVEAESWGEEPDCHSYVSVHMTARDLTGGSYPVEHVSLHVNGLPWFDSGPVSTTVYSKTLGFEAFCGQPFDVMLTAVNSEGIEATAIEPIVTPIP